ncbi:hypothetical protein FQR65_LT14281 [Abscondita terminalis]|nr:hypothetical protein FQR65_LT14281 [Abscondita terminalis]
MNVRVHLFRTIPRLYKQSRHLNDFTPVYQFPFIRGVGLINRLKVYQTAVSILAVPTTAALWEANIVTSDVFVATLGASISGCMLFYSLGIFPNKLIGNVYINKDRKKVKIAYLNFWGKRKDVILDINDITPYTQTSPILSENLYKKYLTESNNDILKINIKYGKFIDKEMFNKIFYD